MKIFTIFDSKAVAYLQPFFSKTEGTAIREIKLAANQEGSQFKKYAEDYSLFNIGEFNEITGKITSIDPIHIINVLPLVDSDNITNIKPLTEDVKNEN